MSQVYALVSNEAFRRVVQDFACGKGKVVLTEQEMYIALVNYTDYAKILN